MAVRALGYIGIQASDVDAWQRYAENIIGVAAQPHENGIRLRLDVRDWRIAVEPGPADDIAFVGWEVDGPSGLAKAVSAVEASGISTTPDSDLARQRGVRELVRFIDPAGVNCELFWGATERFERPFASPTGVTGFLTGAQGLGHVVFAVADPAAYAAFYEQLGFAVSDYIDMKVGPDMALPITFMHCNARHHTLAFAPVPPRKKLIHAMLQVDSLNDVGLALDRATAGNVPISMTLGCHSNDHMVSFYMLTPSGFELEYGWGARSIDDQWLPVRHDTTSIWGHKMMQAPAKRGEG